MKNFRKSFVHIIESIKPCGMSLGKEMTMSVKFGGVKKKLSTPYNILQRLLRKSELSNCWALVRVLTGLGQWRLTTNALTLLKKYAAVIIHSSLLCGK